MCRFLLKGGEDVRRFFLFVSSLVLILALGISASAATNAPKISYFATVTSDSRCQVNMTVTLRLDQVADGLYLPIPEEAANISVNGSRTMTSRRDNTRRILLDRVLGKSVGEITFTVSYSLPDVVHTNEAGLLELQLPMLSGLSCPVELLEFSVALPGLVETLPGFSSGYHQASIEEYLTYSVDGATISGTSLSALKDHETLSMKLAVTDDMFPQTLADTQDWRFGSVGMIVCAVLALVYWLFTLRFLPWRRERCSEPPEGFTAGDMGSVLHLQGMDVTMTVLTWARLGYVTLQTDRKGRVVIQKRMEMGNERKEAEQRLFRTLFSRRDTVDTTAERYAQLCIDTAKKPVGLGELVHRRSGNPRVFRLLAALMGLFGGVCIAIAMSSGALLQGLLILLLGGLGGLSGWYIQSWGRCLLTYDPYRLASCFALCGLWLLLGLAAGIFQLSLYMVLGLVLAGILLAWGGRRTEQGRAMAAQIMGLRRYLRRGDAGQLRQLCQQDPDYFFTMAPYAIALGLGKPFARRFGKLRLESCPYLRTDRAGGTAVEWMDRLQRIVFAMNDRAKRRPMEQLMDWIIRITKH